MTKDKILEKYSFIYNDNLTGETFESQLSNFAIGTVPTYRTKNIYNVYIYAFRKIFTISYYPFKRAGSEILRADSDTTRGS